MSGVFDEDERSMYVSKSEALRTELKMRFSVGLPPPRLKVRIVLRMRGDLMSGRPIMMAAAIKLAILMTV